MPKHRSHSEGKTAIKAGEEADEASIPSHFPDFSKLLWTKEGIPDGMMSKWKKLQNTEKIE